MWKDRKISKQHLATKMEMLGNNFLAFHRFKKQGIGNMPRTIPQCDHLLLERVLTSSLHSEKQAKETNNQKNKKRGKKPACLQ